MFILSGSPMFKCLVKTTAMDPQHRQPIPKHPFVSPQPFCVVGNATAHDGPGDPLHRFNPTSGTEETKAAGAHSQPLLYSGDRLLRVVSILINGGEQQISS